MPARNVMSDRMEQFLRSRLSEEVSSGSERRTFVPSMTISRQCGAGLDQIGSRLVEYLSEVDGSTDCGWALFDQSLIGKIIEEHRLLASVEPYSVENAKFPVVEMLAETLGLNPSQWSLFNYSADTVRKLCHMGNAIVVGRAGNFVTADLGNTFHVRLVGSSDHRVERTSDRYSISASGAREVVRETDKRRKKFVRRYANANISNPQFYHLVFNTDDFSVDGSARLLAESLLDWANEKSKINQAGAA